MFDQQEPNAPDGFDPSGAAFGRVETRSAARIFGERLLTGVLVLALIVLPLFFSAYDLGIFGTYISVTGMFAFMGWSVFSTHRRVSAEKAQELETSTGRRLDILDLPLVVVAWGIAAFIYGELHLEDEGIGVALLLAFGLGALWLRRFLIPKSVVPYHPRNVALRSASIFCGIHFVATLLFGAGARMIGSPPSHAVFFFVLAGILLLSSASFYWLEYRREQGSLGLASGPGIR